VYTANVSSSPHTANSTITNMMSGIEGFAAARFKLTGNRGLCIGSKYLRARAVGASTTSSAPSQRRHSAVTGTFRYEEYRRAVCTRCTVQYTPSSHRSRAAVHANVQGRFPVSASLKNLRQPVHVNLAASLLFTVLQLAVVTVDTATLAHCGCTCSSCVCVYACVARAWV
jgi:hypothetical protein